MKIDMEPEVWAGSRVFTPEGGRGRQPAAVSMRNTAERRKFDPGADLGQVCGSNSSPSTNVTEYTLLQS